MTTLLDIAKLVADEIGLPRPTAVVTSSDRMVQRMLTLCNIEGTDLSREADWTVLQRLYTFTTANGTAEYSLPSDYDRMLRDTEWNRSAYRPIIGPLNPQRWQQIKSGIIGAGLVGNRYRIYRSDSSNTRTFRVDPTPGTTDTYAFEYISNGWCTSSGGTLQSAWAADTDILLLDPRLISLGTVVRMRRSLGLDYASEADEYQQVLARAKGQDRPSPTLNMAGRPLQQLIGFANLPETNYGQ